MASSPLDTAAVLERMADALPADDASALASSYEAVALLVHGYLAALDYRLCGLDEDEPLSDDERARLPRLPPRWNRRFSALAFAYAPPRASARLVVRVDRMGAAVEVRGRAVGDGDGDGGIHRLERPVRSLVDAAALPVRVARDGHGRELRDALPGRLRSVFVSDEAVADLLRDVQVRIVQRITTKLQAEGRVEKGADADADADAESTARAERRAHEACAPPAPELLGPRPGFLPDLARPRPAAPVGDFPPPGFEDEHEINRPPRAGAAPFPDGRSPLAIGHDDLYPPGLGPRDPLVPSRLPRPGGPAGMHPSLDDFLSPARGGGDGPDAGFDPQAPPGARWDPFGPGGGPRLPGRGGHPFGGAAGGHPFGGGGGGHII